MIEREAHGDIALLRMAHGKVNALDLELCEALTEALRAEARSGARAVVLTGRGRSFSAGVDLRRLVEGGAPYATRFLPALDAVFRAVLDLPRPLIAALNGHAIAGGCILAAGCDHVVAADGAGRIGVTELAVGVPFPALPLAMIEARVSPSALRTLVYDAGTFAFDDAQAMGLVDVRCAPEALIPEAMAVATRRAKIPAAAYALTRRTLAEKIYDAVRLRASIDLDAAAAWSSPETLGAISAYLDGLAARRG